MFACAMYPRNEDFLALAEEEIAFQVRRLRQYASVAIWGANNENESIFEEFARNISIPKGESFNRDIAVGDFIKLYVDTLYPILKLHDRGQDGNIARPFVDTSPSNGLLSEEPFVKRWKHSGDSHFGYVAPGCNCG